MLSNEYLAGLIDGEGCISFSCKHKASGVTGIRVDIGLCGSSMIQPLSNYIPTPTIRLSKREYPKNNIMRYRWGGPKAATILERILPHLIIKRKQVVLALQYEYTRKWFRETFGSHTYDPELNQIGLDCQKECSHLKEMSYA